MVIGAAPQLSVDLAPAELFNQVLKAARSEPLELHSAEEEVGSVENDGGIVSSIV